MCTGVTLHGNWIPAIPAGMTQRYFALHLSFKLYTLSSIMEVIYGLIPLMIILGLAMVVIFFWAVRNGQYEDLEGDANRILMDEDDPNLPKNQKQDPRNWPDADDDN
jgi:cbb3-type cytochrome oxidase maturation protein